MTANLIRAALAALERALDATPQGSVTYEEAQALFHRADELAVLIEERLVVLAPDYPDEEDED